MRFDPLSFVIGKHGDSGPVRDVISYLIGRAIGTAEKIWQTLTDVPVAIFTAIAYPLRALTVDVTPVQSGSGDPSPDNVRPITGWSDAKITRCGKNLIVNSIASANVNGSGEIVSHNDFDLFIAPIKSGVDYVITDGESGGTLYAEFATLPVVGDTAPNGRVVITGDTFTASMDGYVVFRTNHGYTTPMIEVGTTATTYEAPITPTTYTVDLNDTRYGGTVDVVAGTMTVTWAETTIGALSWTYNNLFRGTGLDVAIPANNNKTPNILCKQYNPISVNSYSSQDAVMMISQAGQVWITDSRYGTDAAAFSTAEASTPLVYELATPITVTLTPTQINTFSGNNTIFADCGNINTITFRIQ